jgi:hypothetical protein
MSLIPTTKTPMQNKKNPQTSNIIKTGEVESFGKSSGHGNKDGSEEAANFLGKGAEMPVGVGSIGGMVVATQALVTHEAMSVANPVADPVAASAVVGPTSVRIHWAWPSDPRVQEYSTKKPSGSSDSRTPGTRRIAMFDASTKMTVFPTGSGITPA